MSHTATVDVHVKDKIAFEKACRRLGVEYSLNDTVQLFDGATHTGVSVKLPDWKYPVVFTGGKAHYDNCNERWGSTKELDRFRQTYAVEAAKRKARLQGFKVREQQLGDGATRLICQQ